MRNLIIISVLFVFLPFLKGEKIRQLSTLEGLSQNYVKSVFQDSRGFIWVGTNDGLNRYDGYDVKVYRREPRQVSGISSNIISSITEDQQGNLWLGTSDNGICKFDLSTNSFKCFRNTESKPKLLPANRVMEVYADSHDNVWLLTHNGVSVLNTLTEKIHRVSLSQFATDSPNDTSSFCKAICEDEEGTIWLSSKRGLLSIDPHTYEFESVFDRALGRIVYVKDGQLFFGNNRGVFEFDKELQQFFLVLDYRFGMSMTIDDQGDMWLGTKDGLVRARKKDPQGRVYDVVDVYKKGDADYSLNDNFISSLYKDRSGLIWLGSYSRGLQVINPNREYFKHIRSKVDQGVLSSGIIRSIYEDSEHNLWVGTDGAGLNFFPSDADTLYRSEFEYIDLVGTGGVNRAYSIVEDVKHKNVWVGAGFGQDYRVFNVTKNSYNEVFMDSLYITNAIFTSLVDRENTLWLGTYGSGLYRIKYKEDGSLERTIFTLNHRQSYSVGSDYIRSLVEDSKGNIWVGTTNGLSKLSKQEKHKKNPKFYTFRNIPNDNTSISNNYILPLFIGKTGDLWVGTMGGGLNHYKETVNGVGYFETFTTQDGLPNNTIKSILEDEAGNLWLASNKGLTCFDVNTYDVVNYGVNDGLQDFEFSEIAACRRHDGQMLFGGVNGVTWFYPSDIVRDTSKTQLVFTGLEILNRPVEIGEKLNGRVILKNNINETQQLKLKYAENSFTIFYSGLNYSSSDRNKYRYMLEGFDDKWIDASSKARFARYTNLKPGRYTLKVIAANGDMEWNSEAKVMDVRIIAPWWAAWYSYIMYAVMIIVLLMFFRKFTLIDVHQKNRLMMQEFEKEKVEELSQMKLRFFTNISHEFRTPLTLILGPIEKLIREKSSLTEDNVDKIHRNISRNANVLLRLINQLMDFRKFEQGKMKLRAAENNLGLFLDDIYSSFEVYADEKKIKFQLLGNSHDILLWFDAEKLEKVMYNLLSNAFKFTPAMGKITVNVINNREEVIIGVEDNGTGMSPEMQQQIFERFFQANKIENRRYGSTGIGLAYSKGLIEMHKGSIGVMSREGEGTLFSVVLKKGRAHLSDEEIGGVEKYQSVEEAVWVSSHTKEEDACDEDVPSADGAIKTILIVEDNSELRAFVKESFEPDYKVLEAENGKVGLEMTRKETPEIIISDVMMPEMDGFEMCKTIKDDVDISHIPVVLLTAKSSAEHQVKGYNLGADAYVSKPFDMLVLKAQIKSLLDKQIARQKIFDRDVEVKPTEIVSTSMDKKFLERILKIVESNMDNPEFTVEQLASDYGISKVILNRKLKALTGKTAKLFIRSIRIKRAVQLLKVGRYSVSEVTFEVGFSDLKYFRTCFKNEIGQTPSEFKKQYLTQEEQAPEEEKND